MRVVRVFEHRDRVAILGLSLILLVGACSGSATVRRTRTSPQRYVSVVCGAVLNWKDVLEVESSSLVTAESSMAKEVLTKYADALRRDTDAMIAQIQAVGSPALAASADVHAYVTQLLATTRSTLAQAEARDEALAQGGPAALVSDIERSALSLVSALRTRFRDPDPIELSRAAASDADCTKLFRRKAPVGIGA